MWEQYEPPGEQPAEPQRIARRPIVAGRSRAGTGVGIFIGLVAILVVVAITVGAVGSSEPDYSGFYNCVAEKNAEDDTGLLSPADLCEIGNERPPDYVDDHEYDPFEDSGY